MKTNNYFMTKPLTLIMLSIAFVITSCSSQRNISKEAVVNESNSTSYHAFFNSKAKQYDNVTSIENIYFTDANPITPFFYGGRLFTGQYIYSGRGNRFNNITINNFGVNIYSNTHSRFNANRLGRINWSWSMDQLQSWGWINKGWNTPWNQKGWRSNSHSWNGPIWNYWGYDGDSRILREMDLRKLLISQYRTANFQKKRQSVYKRHHFRKNIQRIRPVAITKKQSSSATSRFNNYNIRNSRSYSKSKTEPRSTSKNSVTKKTRRSSANIQVTNTSRRNTGKSVSSVQR